MTQDYVERLAGILATVLIAAMMYLIFAFILWEFNPYEWAGFGRMSYVIFTLLATSTALKAAPNEE